MNDTTTSITAAIFDMDGLIIDSEPYWKKADAVFFANHDKKHTPEINKKIMGMGQREIIAYYKKEYGFTGKTEDLIAERRKLLYEFLLPDLSLLKGVSSFVRALHKKKFQLAIATSGHTPRKAREILAKVGLSEYFSVIVSGDDVQKSKPAPDIYLVTAKKLQVDPSQCLVLEDAPNGVTAGKAAQMLVYAVNKKAILRKELQKAGADSVFTSFKEIVV